MGTKQHIMKKTSQYPPLKKAGWKKVLKAVGTSVHVTRRTLPTLASTAGPNGYRSVRRR